jgi:predicted RNase H-like HicB family nuclease
MTRRVYYGTVCEGGGSYGIVFLDFLGCVSAGDTLEEVIVNGHEALQGHIEAMVADGDAIPDPSEVTIARTERELDDPDEPAGDERWIEVVPIVVSVPDQLETIPVPVEALLIAEIGKIARDNQAFITEAIRRRLDERKEDAA